jgi:hypothetical protein
VQNIDVLSAMDETPVGRSAMLADVFDDIEV